MDIWLDVPTPVEAVLPRRVFLPLEFPLFVGRNLDADIRISSITVGRNHCEIGRDGCGAWVRDLTGRNGTYVNNDRVEAGAIHRLRANDLVSLADCRMRVGWNFDVLPFWLCWESGVLVSLAMRVREEADFSAMPILADALEEVGCTEEGILEHLRGPGPHVRECWILDAILNPVRAAT